MENILLAKSVHDYNAFIGQPDQHPLVSVIDFAAVSPIPHRRCRFSTYALFLRDDTLEDLTYGCSKYDYHEGSLICMGPGQIGGVEYNGKKFRIEGWGLLFHPDVLHGTSLAEQIKDYTFFSYQVNEALHMNSDERDTIVTFLKMIQAELEKPRDPYKNSIIVSYIELVLRHCMRFYNRQFATRKAENSDVLARFETILKKYYESGEQLSEGVPSVQYCAGKLFMSPNYFGDLVRRATGLTAGEHIRRHIIRLAKDRLIAGDTVSQIAFELGFEYPQHLSRMFKKVEKCTPSEYIEKIRQK